MVKALSGLLILTLVAATSMAGTITLVSPGGNETVDGGLRVIVDPYGAFGSAAQPAQNAWFNPPGAIPAAGTTYESGVFLRGGGLSTFLAMGSIGSSGGLPDRAVTLDTPSSASSSFRVGSFEVQLTQSILDRFDSGGSKTGSMLVQDYRISNVGTESIAIDLTRYLDGDLYFSGGFSNDWGGTGTLSASQEQQLFEFDSGDDPANPTTYVGIRAEGGVIPAGAFEIDSYSGLLSRIISGVPLDNTIARDGGDADFITDSPYDITMALARRLVLDGGATSRYVTVTEFGQGATGEVPLEALDTEHIDNFMRGPRADQAILQGNAEYDIEFSSNQALVVTLNVQLVGADPVGPAGEDLRAIWLAGIQDTWSNQYEVVDGIHRYPIRVEVDWVDDEADADVVVTVHQGQGGFDSLNFFTDRSNRATNHAQVAAHEAGHWLGLYDEYTPANGNQTPWWPLYDSPDSDLDAPFVDWGDLFDPAYPTARDNWEQLTAGADETGLMATNDGNVLERYFEPWLAWLVEESGRPGLVLGQEPLYSFNPNPIPENDNSLGTAAVPLPPGVGMAGIALLGLIFRRRRR